MPKRRIIVLGSLMVCIAAALIIFLYPDREPTYQGRTLSEWLDAPYRKNNVKWWPGQEATRAAVRTMGTNAVPFLIKRFRHPPDRKAELDKSPLKERFYYGLWKLRLGCIAERYYDPFWFERLNQTRLAFTALRPCAKDVVPQLIEIYHRRKEDRLLVLHAFALLGAPEAVPFLLTQAPDTNAMVRYLVFTALGETKTDAQTVVPVLLNGLSEAETNARASAAQALNKFGPELHSAIPLLLAHTGNTDPFVRRTVLSALGGVSNRVERILPALLDGLEDPDGTVRASAADALKTLGPLAREAVPKLMQLVDQQQSALGTNATFTENRDFKDKLTQALDAITERKTIYDSRLATPDNLHGKKLFPLATSAAYNYVATASMLAEVNFFAERLRLHAHLPIMESDIRQLYVGPPRLLRFLGAVDTDEYSFGFAESGRLRFVTKLHPFGNQPLPQLQRRLAQIDPGMSTNTAYQLATDWLVAVSVDVKVLEQQFPGAVRQHFYRGTAGNKVLLPIFDVLWGKPDAPAVIATIYGPTAELLQLRQNNESFSLRPTRAITNDDIEMLLAIPDAEFANYTAAQRARLPSAHTTEGGNHNPLPSSATYTNHTQ